MRTWNCNCGAVIFFDNTRCLACSCELGFCPACGNLSSLVPAEAGGWTCGNAACGAALVKCANYAEHDVCNRCIASNSANEGTLCDCCKFNATIPDLTVAGNLQKWYRLETAKRRLFYDLNLLKLPYESTTTGEVESAEPELSFDFKADVIPKLNYWRSVGKSEKVYTGHANGRITINIREADDVAREKLRVELGEAHRTLIGHFRHEIGHFFWDRLVKNRDEADCVAVFGDHNAPTYAEALDAYYQDGPPADWAQNFISAYATMHPWEDFAETWAAYLDMISALDTAQHHHFGAPFDPAQADLDVMVVRYQELGIALNEINRTMGLLDLVPEVFVAPVVAKLRYIHALIRQGRDEAPA